MARPDMTQPDTTQPDMARPDMARPDTTQPDIAGPDVPESLLLAGLDALWATVRHRLDRNGPAWRGTVSLPDLDRAAGLSIASLIGRRPPRRLDLNELEAALLDRSIGRDLCDAISRLGHPPSVDAAERREARARTRAARDALREATESWREPWATDWAAEVRRSGIIAGLDGVAVTRLVADVRRLIDHLEAASETGVGRTEAAAALFGSAHALDRGHKLATATEAALRFRIDAPGLRGRELWETAGVQTDLVSAPVLTWALPATGASPLGELIRAAGAGAIPVHLTLMALRRHPVSVPAGTLVLVVENPRLVEAAAERTLPGSVVATNGNPTAAVWILVEQLLGCGTRLLYHGDFDTAGLDICRRMQQGGCRPTMMAASDYEAAVEKAAQSNVELEREPRECGSTPWDPKLRDAFNRRRLIVHEEFLLDHLLDEFNALVFDP
ncbi:MAG: DUF2399 domain-containing protein [Acidimicrobiaceae bacterium]|nr:DUF2399 domain-containing protein [Acidimicrobiaceae bacterium]